MKLSYEEGAQATQILVKLEKESPQVRQNVINVVKRLGEIFNQEVDDRSIEKEIEISDSERISVYRAVISVLNKDEYSHNIMAFALTTAKAFKFEKQLSKKFKLDEDVTADKDFKFDEEYEILEDLKTQDDTNEKPEDK